MQTFTTHTKTLLSLPTWPESMSRSSKGRAFVYSANKPSVDTSQQPRKRKRSPGSAATCTDKTAGGSIAKGPNSGSRGLASKVQKVSIAEFDDDDFDEVGAAALDEYEQSQRSVPPTDTLDTPTHSTNTGITVPTTTKQCYSYRRDPSTNPSAQSDPIQQAMDELREDNFTKDGEVKVLRSEKDRLLSELRKREEQMREIQSRLTIEKNIVQTQLSKEKDSLTAKLQFQEQEIVSLREKYLLLEQHKKSPGTSKPIPTSRPIKTAISSKTSSTTFLSTESFMPRSQINSAEVTPVHVKPKRARSVSLSDKKPEVVKSKKVRVARSPTTTPLNSLSGKTGSKNTKNTSPCNKPPGSVSVDPSMILSVQGRELDDPQLLMLLVRRDLLKPPVFLSTNEQEEAEPSPVVVSDKDSQSSDEESSQSGSEDSQNSITGLLSLLRVQPKPKTFSGYSTSFVTPVKALDSSLLSTSESSPSACTPVRQKRMQLLKPHTLARMDLARPRMEKPGSSLLQSLSANNTPINCAYDERTSSLFSSIDKKGLEVSIGALLQSADLSSISRTTTACATSFCPNKLHSRMLENSNLHLLIRNVTATVLQYHADQSAKAKGTANTSILDGGDTTDSSMSLGSHKSISSTGSSKASSELFSPLKCDQQLVSKFLEILYTLVSYYQCVREQILYQPSKLIFDSRPRSSINVQAPSSTGSFLDREGVVSTILKPAPPDLAEVSRRLSFKRDRSCTPDSPTKAENDYQSQPAEGKQWKKQQLCNINHHSCNLSTCVWTQKKMTPQNSNVLDQSFSLPASRVRVSDGGGLFNVLLEMPAPPWRESKKNVVTCLKILSTLAEHCSIDALQQFSSLLADDVLGPCLDKDDPAIVRATLSLLTHLVRSPVIVGLLCSCSPPSPCVPVNCYDICLQTMPDEAHRQSGYTNQLQVVRLISTALVADNGVAVLLTSSCQCTRELLKTFVSLLSNLLDNVQDTSQWTRQELTVVLEVISLLHKISIHDNYFDSHLYECDHTYNSVMSSLHWLLATHPTPLREVAMVTDLLECAEDLDDSEEIDKMDIQTD